MQLAVNGTLGDTTECVYLVVKRGRRRLFLFLSEDAYAQALRKTLEKRMPARQHIMMHSDAVFSPDALMNGGRCSLSVPAAWKHCVPT